MFGFIASLFGVSRIAATLIGWASVVSLSSLVVGGIYLKGRMDGYAVAQVEELKQQIATRDRIIQNFNEAAKLGDQMAAESESTDRGNDAIISEMVAAAGSGPGCISPDSLRRLQKLR